MEKGIDLAKANAANTLDEIAYLRKQLVIGQSTLDSVLSAEARLYDAESKEINFMADKHLAELTILSATGLLSDLLSLD
jgi:outer membrane protein TolC